MLFSWQVCKHFRSLIGTRSLWISQLESLPDHHTPDLLPDSLQTVETEEIRKLVKRAMRGHYNWIRTAEGYNNWASTMESRRLTLLNTNYEEDSEIDDIPTNEFLHLMPEGKHLVVSTSHGLSCISVITRRVVFFALHAREHAEYCSAAYDEHGKILLAERVFTHEGKTLSVALALFLF